MHPPESREVSLLGRIIAGPLPCARIDRPGNHLVRSRSFRHNPRSRERDPIRYRAARLIFLAASSLAAASCAAGGSHGPVYSGTIEAVEVDVVPEVSGRILVRQVDQGDAVEAGSPVAQVDPEPYRITLAEATASLRSGRAKLTLLTSGYRREEVAAAGREVDEAEAQVAQAEARISRVEDLVRQQVGTPDDLDVARRDLDVARARLWATKERHALLLGGYRGEEIEQARAEVARLEALRDRAKLDLERTTVRSPLKGTVTEKLQEVGEYARPGSPIVAVADLVNLYTWVYVTQVELAGIRTGDDVAVRIDGAPGKEYPGKVIYISKEAEFTPKNVQTVQDRAQLVFGVKVAVTNNDGSLKVGIPADVVLKSPAGS
jgi:HlyD family secretion protein